MMYQLGVLARKSAIQREKLKKMQKLPKLTLGSWQCLAAVVQVLCKPHIAQRLSSMHDIQAKQQADVFQQVGIAIH